MQQLPGGRVGSGIWSCCFPTKAQLLALPVLCLCTPSGQHPQLLDGGSCWEAAASWWFQLSSPGPRAADGTQGLAHSHEASPITCLEVTSTESVVIWQEWRAVWFGREFQNGPRQSRFGREEALGWEMVVQRNHYLSQAPALTAPNPYPNVPREGKTEKGSPYTNLSQRILS